MDSKLVISGSVGFMAGVIATLLIGALLMGSMMWRGGMMRGWRCNSLNDPAPMGAIAR